MVDRKQLGARPELCRWRLARRSWPARPPQAATVQAAIVMLAGNASKGRLTGHWGATRRGLAGHPSSGFPGDLSGNARKEGTERRQASFAHKDALELVRFVNDLRFGTELLGQLPLIVSFPSQIQDKHSPLSQRVVDLVEICAHRIVKSPG